MLDGNLPTFYLKPASDGKKHHLNYILSQGGNEPTPAYSLQHPDPASPTSKNLYAAALFDSYNPEVLFGEVLLRPEWTQPSLSQEEIRKNGGVPPAPEPIMPKEFTIQLYNPDQQIVVRQKTTSWGTNPSYHFEVPQHSFRTPSNSVLDQQLSDPAADITTPMMNFAWRRDGRMSKDFTCYMTGKSTDPQGKHGKKGKDPDIVVAIFQALKEVTVYEPNLVRVEVEDPKGLEVVLLLGAAVIRDVFYGQLRDTFNIGEPAPSGRRRKSSSPMEMLGAVPNPPLSTSAPPPGGSLNGAQPPSQKPQLPPPSRNDGRRQSFPPPNANAAHNIPPQSQSNRFYAQAQTQNRPPPMDPRSQWETDAEAARLRAASDAEKRATEAARKEREKRDAAEQKRIKKMLEVEEKERRRKQAEVDKETERLRKKYGNQQNLAAPPPMPQRHSAPNNGGSWYSGGRPVQQQAVPPPRPVSHPRPAPQARPPPAQPPRPSGHGHAHSHLRPITIGSARPPQQPAPRPQHHGPYLAPHGGSRPAASVSSFFASNGLPLRPAAAPARPHPVPAPAPHGFVKQPKKGKSFFGLRSISENQAVSGAGGQARPAMPGAWPSGSGQGRLAKKKSSLW